MEYGQIGKTQNPPSMACSARAVHGAGRFPLLTVFPVPLSFFIAANINTPFSEDRFFQTDS
jgi:hypothetical protein